MSDVSGSSDKGPWSPDYDLDPEVRADTPTQLKAMAHPVRSAILHMLLERAATTGEMAGATGKSHGTVSHHLRVLEDAGLVRVVRTRQVRAITERFWGRTGRTIMVDPLPGDPDGHTMFVREAVEAFVPGEHGFAGMRYARISDERVDEFCQRLWDLMDEFLALPRSGDTTYGLVMALQATAQPALADRPDGPSSHPASDPSDGAGGETSDGPSDG